MFDIRDGLSLMRGLGLTAREAACVVVDVRHGIDRPHPHSSAHEAEVSALAQRLSRALAP